MPPITDLFLKATNAEHTPFIVANGLYLHTTDMASRDR